MNMDYTTIAGHEPMAIDQQWEKLQIKDNWLVFNPILGEQNRKLFSSIQSYTDYGPQHN